MNKEKFGKAMEYLFASKAKMLNETVIQVWYDLLKEYPEDKVFEAMKTLAVSPDDFITVGKIVELAQPINIGQSWQRVVVCARCGCSSWDELTDLEVATVSAIGGMHAIQNGTEESLHFLFNDFQKAMPAIAKRQVCYDSQAQKLKDLNVWPETYQFLTKEDKTLMIEAVDNYVDKKGDK